MRPLASAQLSETPAPAFAWRPAPRVSRPRRKLLVPFLPCEAMTVRSQLRSPAVLMLASQGLGHLSATGDPMGFRADMHATHPVVKSLDERPALLNRGAGQRRNVSLQQRMLEQSVLLELNPSARLRLFSPGDSV